MRVRVRDRKRAREICMCVRDQAACEGERELTCMCASTFAREWMGQMCPCGVGMCIRIQMLRQCPGAAFLFARLFHQGG